MDSTQGPVTHRSYRQRLKYTALIVIIVLALLCVLVDQWLVHEQERSLRAVTDILDRTEPGWRLADIESARAVVPEPDNSGPHIEALCRQLRQSVNGRVDPIVSIDLSERIEMLPPAVVPDLEILNEVRESIEKNRPLFDEALKLADRPHGRFKHHYGENTYAMPIPQNNEIRKLAGLLRVYALERAASGDGDGALRACRAVVHLATPMSDDPISVSQLLRVAIWFVSARTVEAVLGQTEPSEAELMLLQRSLTAEEPAPLYLHVARGERATLFHFAENMRAGRASFAEIGNDKNPSWWTSLNLWFYGRYRSGTDTAATLLLLNDAISVAKLPPQDRIVALEQWESEVRRSERTPMILMIPAFTKINEAGLRGQAILRCTITALAAERFRTVHGRLPEAASELVPEFLSGIFDDPFDGRPLRVRRETNQLVIYSVGPDLTDNGGIYHRNYLGEIDTDIGFTLWDVPHRRQPPPEAAR